MELYIKAGGAVLIAASGMLAGICASREYAQRVREIEAMILNLGRMRAEIELRLTPMDEIFRELALSDGPCALFFTSLSTALSEENEDTLHLLWQRAAMEAFKPSAERDILIELGTSLGCLDAEQECRAIDYTITRLRTELEQAREENMTQGVLRKRLGAAAGIGLAILFL